MAALKTIKQRVYKDCFPFIKYNNKTTLKTFFMINDHLCISYLSQGEVYYDFKDKKTNVGILLNKNRLTC